MTRKEFIADLAAATSRAFRNLYDIQKGEEDGEITFTFVILPGQSIELTAALVGGLYSFLNNLSRRCI